MQQYPVIYILNFVMLSVATDWANSHQVMEVKQIKVLITTKICHLWN